MPHSRNVSGESGLSKTIIKRFEQLPSAQPYTDEEIQKMQDIEQAQLDKAYEMGKADAMAEIIRCKECENWHMYRNRGEGWCDQWKDMFMDISFCSSAKRREGDKGAKQ